MKGNDLATDDHVVRYIKPSMILEEPPKTHQLSEVRRLFRLSVRPNGRFAELDVGTTLRAVSKELATLRVLHDPLDAVDGFDADPSHAEIVGLPPGDSDEAALVGDLIAECVVDMHPAIAEDRG